MIRNESIEISIYVTKMNWIYWPKDQIILLYTEIYRLYKKVKWMENTPTSFRFVNSAVYFLRLFSSAPIVVNYKFIFDSLNIVNKYK